MKSRKVKAYNASKRRKAEIPLDYNDDSDIDSDSFYHDEIDDFNNKKDDELSTDDELIRKEDESSDEEEVLPITDDEKEESEDEESESEDDDDKESEAEKDKGNESVDDEDSESESEDDDLPNLGAWGKKKSTYYSTDFEDKDWGKSYRENDAEDAKAEEEGAAAGSKTVLHSVFHNFTDPLHIENFEKSTEEKETENKETGSRKTKKEIIMYLKTHTKFFEYKALLESSIQKLKKILKLYHLIQIKKIRSKKVQLYVRVKKQILSLIIHNINIYLMLLSTGNPKQHPVHQSIAHFKQLLDDLERQDQVLTPVINKILIIQEEEIDISSDLENITQSIPQSMPSSPKGTTVVNSRKTIKKNKVKHMETETEKEVMSLIGEVKEETRKRKLKELEKDGSDDDDDDDLPENMDQPENDNEANTDEKRVISYEIAKNKGLAPHRKKEYRNPRVRHRMKYRKAQIRRKGQVRNVVTEVQRYGGEPTGINSNVVKSIKFK